MPNTTLADMEGIAMIPFLKYIKETADLSLPPVKIHCSVLAEDAIKAAIADYQSKKK
jgi:NifU-like protein involved in Fe-S cluster formation